MSVPCSCCSLGITRCTDTGPDVLLGLGSNDGGVVIQTGAAGFIVPMIIQFTNWSGLGFNGSVSILWDGPVPVLQPTQILHGNGGSGIFTFSFDTPQIIRRMAVLDFDGPAAEQLFNIDPPIESVTSSITLGPCNGSGTPPAQGPGRGCVRSVGANINGFIIWPAHTISNHVSFIEAKPAAFSIVFPSINLGTLGRAEAFSCNGVVQWYDTSGNLVSPASLFNCPGAPSPFCAAGTPELATRWTAFDDGVFPTQESLCSMVPPPTRTANTVTDGPGCFGSLFNGIADFVWECAPSIDISYTQGTGTNAGASIFTVTLAGVTVTWPVVGELAIAASNLSNVINGRQVRLTAVSGANGFRPRWNNTTQIQIGLNPPQPTTPVRFRLDII